MQNLRYLAYLCRHKYFVALAGRQVGVSWWRLLIHDYSKFSRTEFGPYRRRFFAGRSGTLDKERDPEEFHRAFAHHWHNNPHHWEFHLRMKDPQVVPLSMPVKFAREMVADWMGASRAITGGWNAADWYVKNKDRILVHADTRLQVELLLSLADLRLNGKKSEGLDVSAC